MYPPTESPDLSWSQVLTNKIPLTPSTLSPFLQISKTINILPEEEKTVEGNRFLNSSCQISMKFFIVD